MSNTNSELFDLDREEQVLSDPLPPSGGLGRWMRRLVAVILGLVLVGGAVYASSLAFKSADDGPAPSMLTHAVQRGEMLVTVTEDGNVESAKNVEIKCQVAGGSSILWIVKDGSQVKEGEKLVELDASQLDDQINAQKITYEKARSALVQAEKDFQVAEISVKEYLEGTFKKELQDAEAQITIALENLRTSQNMLQHSQRMFRKGYISTLELEGQQFSVQRSQLELDSARTAKDVLENFTKVKMIEDLQSKVETAKAKLESEKAAFTLEESRLKRLEDQKGFCLINATQDGMVVYANEQMGGMRGGQQGPQIEEGAAVRERQTILRLPDLSQMQVKVNVHETKVEQLRVGMRARIRILGRELQGAVHSIANQPEPTSFFSASVKEYATIVRIDGQPEGLRPGMTAEVEILVAHLKDVLTLPVAAIVEQRGKYFCWVATPGKVERRSLVLGLNNDRFVEVQDGVSETDQVLLNPRAVVAEARAAGEEAETNRVREQFGEAKPGAAPEPDTRRGPSKDSPNAGGGPGTQAGAAGSGPNAASGGPAGGGPGGGPGGPGGGFDLMASDKDGDGKISKAEAPEFMQAFFDRVDTNGDGMLDKAEMEVMRQRRVSGGSRGGSRNLMQFDKNGDGKVTADEVPAEMQGILERADANQDGAVDAAEIEQLRSRFPPGGGGGPGGGPGGP
ncbi:MAG: HlyD family efflux transporter periplasmic adaptor subunit [Candidatus Anammoximicrobium sp.]|nr:HlyD family efflux transporter periplasmic adaptor subunit [Candidatus Anammoximicrobium sp.]